MLIMLVMNNGLLFGTPIKIISKMLLAFYPHLLQEKPG
ncbi:hypothetical protein RV10_GL000727 [Enterococcus pallens]|nr:hypothetical protein RV10_GL000727 [Enterococcus pallens]